MKKGFFVLFCFCLSFNVLYAECNYTEVKNLNLLASHIDYNYIYDEGSQTFTLVLNNIPNKLYVKIDEKTYNPVDNSLSVSGFNFGNEISVNVYSSNLAPCVNEYVRMIKVKFPYLNNYYNSSECEGHESLEVCNNRFLSYKLSSVTFNRLIKEDFDKSTNDSEVEKPDEIKVEKTKISTVILKYLKVISIPFVLVLVSSLLTISVCSVIYRKIKHGL